MACPKPQMDRETAFTRMLGLTRSWSLGGGDLRLSGEDGSVLAVFRPEPTPAVKK
jgi:heat shock protein HslJ